MIRVLNNAEVEDLLREGVKGGDTMSVRSVLDIRSATVKSVTDDGMSSIVTAVTPRGRIEMMGVTPYDAVQRLATHILRVWDEDQRKAAAR